MRGVCALRQGLFGPRLSGRMFIGFQEGRKRTEFENFHDAMKKVSKDKGPETLVELIDIWKKNPEATFVVFHPVTGMPL